MQLTESQKALLVMINEQMKDPGFAKALVEILPVDQLDENAQLLTIEKARLEKELSDIRKAMNNMPTELLWRFSYNQMAHKIEQFLGIKSRAHLAPLLPIRAK